MTKQVLLKVNDLHVTFGNDSKRVEAVKGISFDLLKGQSMGIVGESGSGKSVSSLSILNLLSDITGIQIGGSITYIEENEVHDLLTVNDEIYRIRGGKISLVMQEPMSALNPVRRCGGQVKEMLDVHEIGPKESRKDRVLELLKMVALDDVDRVYTSYPHELSGGQLQRVNIAMALAADPDVVICDEPTTALDVSVQKQILDLLKRLSEELNLAMIFVSHDLDVVNYLCDSVLVMYRGQVVESGKLPDVFHSPVHPYTIALLHCKPTRMNRDYVLPTVEQVMNQTYHRTERKRADLNAERTILQVDRLTKRYKVSGKGLFKKSSFFTAVDEVSFDLLEGEILGIVGESGSGKSTVANCIAGLIDRTEGNVLFRGKSISSEVLRRDKRLRIKVQLVFQDPYSSLNPQMSIGDAIAEPLKVHAIVPREKVRARTVELLEQVGLDSSYLTRYPHQLSGGQRQRACIARALSLQPELLICDESVSALDVSVQAQILNLLDELRNKLNLSMIFISHDLSVVQYICDRVVVMKRGRVVEQGEVLSVLDAPKSQYTKALLEAIPPPIQTT